MVIVFVRFAETGNKPLTQTVRRTKMKHYNPLHPEYYEKLNRRSSIVYPFALVAVVAIIISPFAAIIFWAIKMLVVYRICPVLGLYCSVSF